MQQVVVSNPTVEALKIMAPAFLWAGISIGFIFAVFGILMNINNTKILINESLEKACCFLLSNYFLFLFIGLGIGYIFGFITSLMNPSAFDYCGRYCDLCK